LGGCIVIVSNFLFRSLIALGGICLSASPIFAHKLLLDCRLRDDRLRVEAFYDDDTPAQNAKIVVENDRKQVVAKGLTDEKGCWNCAVPTSGEYTVRAESIGHAAKETLAIKESALDNSRSIERKISSEPAATRDEKTAMPWVSITIGLAMLACLGALVWFIRGRKRTDSPKDAIID
jgi:hypothetical protein